MKAKDIKELSSEEINLKIREASEELVNLKLRKRTGQVEKPHKIKELRRQLARLNTFLNIKSNIETKA